MKKLLAILVLMCAGAFAQTTHKFGALDTNNSWTGNNTFSRFIFGTYTAATKPSSPISGMTVVITDGASNSDCSIGGQGNVVLCEYSGSTWVALTGGGGGGGAVSAVSGDGVLVNNISSTGNVVLTLANAQAHKYWGNNTGATGAPSYFSIVQADLPSATVFNNQSNTFSTGTQDFSAVTLFKARVGAALTTSVNGDFGYDTTNKNWHFWGNGVDNINVVTPAASIPTNNHCAQWALVSNVLTLVDSGGACGGSSGVASFTGDGAFYTNSASTGAVTATLHTALAHKYWGNNTGSTGTPGYFSIVTGDLPFTYSGSTTTLGTVTGSISGTSLICGDGSGNLTTTGCSSGATTWNGISNPTGAQSLSMGNNTTTWTWGAATGAATNLLSITDTTANTGTGYGINYAPLGTAMNGFNINLPTSSTGVAFRTQLNGVTNFQISAAGQIDNSGATAQFLIPRTGTAVASSNGGFIFDTTKLAYHGYINGADAVFPGFTGTPTNGNCATWVTAGTTFTLGSATCGSISGSASSGQGTFWSGGSALSGNANWTYSASSGHAVTQGANNADAFFINRFTDTAPTGNFLHFQNNAKASDLFKVDVSGNVTAVGSATLGTSGTAGTVALSGSSSGVVTIQPGAAAAGTYNYNLPTSAGTAKQIQISGGGGSTAQSYIDFPDVKIIPAANCNNTTAGTGWSLPASGWTPTCRAGTNNLGGSDQVVPSAASSGAQFMTQIPVDWDTSVKPYIRIYYGSGANTSGTVILTISTACTNIDGSVTDDPSFIAESAMGTQTMAAASRMWSQSAELAGAMTNCVGGSPMIVKVAVTGTASSAITVYQATVTVPRLLQVQAN